MKGGGEERGGEVRIERSISWVIVVICHCRQICSEEIQSETSANEKSDEISVKGIERRQEPRVVRKETKKCEET